LRKYKRNLQNQTEENFKKTLNEEKCEGGVIFGKGVPWSEEKKKKIKKSHGSGGKGGKKFLKNERKKKKRIVH